MIANTNGNGRPTLGAPDVEEIARSLGLFARPGGVIELRAPDGPGGAQIRRFRIEDPATGLAEAAAEAIRYEGRAPAVYVTMNEIGAVDPDHAGTRAGDIVRRRFLLVDCDPVRPSDTSATDDEKAAARAVAEAIREHLRSEGWPEPILADSGNGCHLLYAIDLPNDEPSKDLVKRCLKALAARFDTPGAKVDQAVHDAPRIVKVYGTAVRKGEPTAERPHRRARLIEVPDPLEPVPTELLEALADAPALAEALAEVEAEERAPKPPPKGGRDPVDAYVRAAVADELAILSGTGPGRRNVQLNKSAFKLGTLVGARRLARTDAVRHLAAAARDTELGEAEYLRTIARGLDAGIDRPRDLSRVGRPAPGANGHTHANGAVAARIDVVTTAEDDLLHDDHDDVEIVDRWPVIKEEAFHGLAGEIVRKIDPHTESDPVATLAQLFVAFGNLIGRGPHFTVSATRHYLVLFLALVGATAAGRKGTSWDIVWFLLRVLDPAWAEDRIQGGLVSGEGLIHHIRDPTTGEKEVRASKGGPVTGKEQVVIDPGVSDKRLLIVETELGRMFKAMNSERNTLSDVARQAWDCRRILATLGKQNPSKATGAHVSIVGHVTQPDVHKHLTETDSANGFGNRFLWVCCRRSKSLPDGGDLYSVDWAPIHQRLMEIVAHARGVDRMTRDRGAATVWRGIYDQLSGGRPGLIGAILGRAEAQVMRIACHYALFDMADVVRSEHLTAALAFWDYCEASARFVFGDSLGDPDAERLLEALGRHPEGLTRKQIANDVFNKHRSSAELASVLSRLLDNGFIHRQKGESTGGRPPEIWHLGRPPA